MKYVENVFANYTSKENIERIKCFDSIKQLWETSVKEFANEVALADPNRKLTYAKLEEEVAKFRSVLLSKGIKKGDFVGVYAPNTIEWAKKRITSFNGPSSKRIFTISFSGNP